MVGLRSVLSSGWYTSVHHPIVEQYLETTIHVEILITKLCYSYENTLSYLLQTIGNNKNIQTANKEISKNKYWKKLPLNPAKSIIKKLSNPFLPPLLKTKDKKQ